VTVENIAQVLHHSKATGATKLVLVGIANHAGDGGAFPAMETLATYAGIDVSGVRRHMRTLEKLGEVTVETNGGGDPKRPIPKHMRPNLFHIDVPCPPNCQGAPKHKLLCDVCNEPLRNSRRKAGTCTPGDCCPLSGALAARMGRRCPGDERGNHAPGLCQWPEVTE